MNMNKKGKFGLPTMQYKMYWKEVVDDYEKEESDL